MAWKLFLLYIYSTDKVDQGVDRPEWPTGEGYVVVGQQKSTGKHPGIIYYL